MIETNEIKFKKVSDMTAANSIRPSQTGVEIIQPHDQYDNRRSEPRFDCVNKGCLLYFSKNEVFNCKVVNQSASGAQVIYTHAGKLPAEIWLIDLDTQMAKCGTVAWSMSHKMGLKFSLVFKLEADTAPSPKVPNAVYLAWKNASGFIDKPPSEDVFFLD
jgi:hypothetical protein